jgi:hypothetical protein
MPAVCMRVSRLQIRRYYGNNQRITENTKQQILLL